MSANQGSDDLFIQLLGNADEFINMLDDAVTVTEDSANRLAASTNEMASIAGRDLAQAAEGWKEFSISAVGYGTTVLGVLADLYAAYVSLQAVQGSATAAGAGGAASGAGGILAGLGITSIGTAAGVAAAALATFFATFTATTYLISGSEGIWRAPGNILEGLKYILYGVTAGYVDLTEATKRQASADAAFAQQQVSGTAEVLRRKEAAAEMFRTMEDAIKGMKDHSQGAEDTFVKKFIGDLGQLGPVTAMTEALVKQQAARAFANERIAEYTDKLEKEAATYKMTRAEQAEYILNLNKASAAQRQEMMAIVAKMDAIDKAAEKKREDERQAKEAERDAKRAADDAKRQHDRLVEEGKALHSSLMTPMERLQEEARNAQRLFHENVISAEDLRRVMERLEAGPKEIHKRVKVSTVSGNDIGVTGKEFGSVEEIAAREAYRQNIAASGGMKPRGDILGRGGVVPVAGADAASAAKAEAETKAILVEMKNALSSIASNTNPRNAVRLQPAKIGSR